MKISASSRNTRMRNPSHLGSKIQSSPVGILSTRLASIGSTGGLTGRFTPSCYNGTPALRGEQPAHALRTKFRNFAVVGEEEEDVTSSAGSNIVGRPLLHRTTLRLPGSVQH